jgi:hypothetical protein
MKMKSKKNRMSTLVIKISEASTALSSYHCSATNTLNMATVRTSVVGSLNVISWYVKRWHTYEEYFILRPCGL